MEVQWSTDAVRSLLELARQDQRQAERVADAIRQYERTGTGNVRALQGSTRRLRLRVGDWRVILAVEGNHALVLEVVLRRDAYD